MNTLAHTSGRYEIAVIGAGPAGLMAAEVAAAAGAQVTVFDRMPSPARKLLFAGRGGLNLTHSEEMAVFLRRYGAAADRLNPAIQAFGPDALRRWCADLGIETFVGSSGRVFPVSFKTSPLLRAWLRRLGSAGVRLESRHHWLGWDDAGRLLFATPDGARTHQAAATVLALGGASWPQLGSNGSWVEPLKSAGVDVAPLQPANCGFTLIWSATFRDRFEGEPLKNIALNIGELRSRGDLMVTRVGLEGGAIYPLAAPLRTALARDGSALLHLALRPDLAHDALVARLGARKQKQSFSTALRKTLHLSPVALGLLREAELPAGPGLAALDAPALARLINAVPLRLCGATSIDRAISTAGGVSFAECDDHLMLRRRPGTFVAGEMLDWEAPTGGYLLQASFATGALTGRGALAWLGRDTSCVRTMQTL